MANLKGSSHSKNLRDLNFKLFALGEKKGNDNLSHSSAIVEKRNMYMRDFIKHLDGAEGKLNLLLTEENLNSFLEQRLNGLALSTQENYLSGFNSLISAMSAKNITHGVSKDYFKNKFSEIKQTAPNHTSNERRGLPSNTVLNELKEIRYESYVIGTIMLEHGYRISEVLRIVSAPHEYIIPLSNGDYKISGVVGKGGKIYLEKILTHSTMRLINNINEIPSKSSFHRDLKLVSENLRAHDFRYEYSRNLYNDNVSKVGDKKALEIVSKALNHNRLEISKLYVYS